MPVQMMSVMSVPAEQVPARVIAREWPTIAAV